MTDQGKEKRFLARKILFCGVEHSLSVVTISNDEKACRIEPFSSETEATIYIDGRLVVERVGDKFAICQSDDASE